MKLLNKISLVLLTFMAVSLFAQANDNREHRAIWMSPYLSGNWPPSAITAVNAENTKTILQNRLDKLRDQNINVLYYHVRAMCDANYESSYEPWSSHVSGTRGVAPAFDPFEYLIEQAHLRGIEVYGWLNPYRYHEDTNGSWGAHELNYENSHPDWLISGNSKNTVLNPALEAVKQRIVEVCREVVTKYDVDGIIFDDYFYPQGGTTESSSAPDYAQYKVSGTTLSIGDWRRANVNEMLKRVYEMIKSVKPYVCFGVSPAGTASPPNIASYGLPAGPSGDWQYSTIYSDPIAWLNAGTLDFISPQVYWTTKSTTNNFNRLTEWWSNAAQHFGRHLYESVNLSGDNGLTDLPTHGVEESLSQLEAIRQYCPENTAGYAYFQYSQVVGYSEKYNGSRKPMTYGEIVASTLCPTKVLTPLRTWNNVINPKMVSNVKRTGNTITWDAVDGVRYTVYAVPESLKDADFFCQKEYLEQICYTNSFKIPEDTTIYYEYDRAGNITYSDTTINNKTKGYRWAVAVYDRYGNEYGPLFVGATATTTTAATLTFPVKGAPVPGLFEFTWTGEGTKFTVEVAEDAAFTKMFGVAESSTKFLSSSNFPAMQEGKTYYWRVRSSKPNSNEAVSAAETFVYSKMSLNYPTQGATGVSTTATFTWSNCGTGMEYLLEIFNATSQLVYSKTLTQVSHTIPEMTLSTGSSYTARVTASKNGSSVQSEAVTFTTENVTSYSAPVIAVPARNGAVIYSNESIKVNPWSGLTSVNVEVSTSSSFPVRSTKAVTLTDFATATPALGSSGWTGSYTNGTTYYVRVIGQYRVTTTTTTQKTAYSAVRTFVYNSDTGIDEVATDNSGVYVNNEDVLVIDGDAAQVDIYAVSGQLIESVSVTGDYDLKHLATGAYVIKVASSDGTFAVKFVK